MSCFVLSPCFEWLIHVVVKWMSDCACVIFLSGRRGVYLGVFFFFFFPSFGGYIPAAMDDVSRRLQEVKEVETFHLLDIFRYDLSIPVDHITSYTRRYGMRCKSRVVHTPR